MVYKTFPTGGVHPEEEKLTSSSVVQTLALPVYVALPLSQHIGTPALPVVSRGEKVRTGQLLASAQGFISANIHASVSGRVNRIDTVTDMSGYRQPAIIIDREGDEWDENIDLSKDLIMEIRHTPEEIIKKCSDAGLVGMGGAAFPTHAKLAIPEGKKCNILIINGVECEPYLTSDHRLMIERGEEMMTGVAIIMKALRVSRAVIGIETNKPDAIENLNRISSAYNGISVQGLMVKYPQGAEKQLVKAILNREVPPGKLPSDLGVMVQNVATALAVYEAVQKNKPLIERIVTVTGKLLAAPGNFYVRTGTPVINLIEAAGGLPVDTGKIIIGGPMMGKAINSTEVPVVKGTSGIVILSERESKRKEIQPCIRCAKCSAVCSFSQEPYLLMTLAAKGLWERAEAEGITECMECGSCSYVCPANRPLLDYIRLGKITVNRMIRERQSG